jgi:hypothetical protein
MDMTVRSGARLHGETIGGGGLGATEEADGLCCDDGPLPNTVLLELGLLALVPGVMIGAAAVGHMSMARLRWRGQ